MRIFVTFFCRCWVIMLVLAGGHAVAAELVVSSAASLTEAFNVRLSGLADLDIPAVKRIAMGQSATVPAGRYTKEALEAAKLWRNVESKLVFAQTVRHALTYVVRGDVDAGFVYITDAAIVKDKVRVITEVSVKDTREPISGASAGGGKVIGTLLD